MCKNNDYIFGRGLVDQKTILIFSFPFLAILLLLSYIQTWNYLENDYYSEAQGQLFRFIV